MSVTFGQGPNETIVRNDPGPHFKVMLTVIEGYKYSSRTTRNGKAETLTLEVNAGDE